MVFSVYSQPTTPINLVDFSKHHDPNNYFHYCFATTENNIKCWTYVSFERSTKSVVYRGNISYWKRRNPNIKEDYVNVTHSDVLQKKMKEILQENN